MIANGSNSVLGDKSIRDGFKNAMYVFYLIGFPVLLGLLFIKSFVLKPKALLNYSNICFICWTIGLLETFGLVLSEYNPFINDVLNGKNNYICNQYFGFPNE